MPIQILADDVVARIAAGEAVERPASAVKELIENAIDAGATSIHIETSGGGRRMLRVSDNGSGIRREEIELAFKRHATSKLRSAEELEALNTLGFRGEALSSLAAVSKATIVTRHRDEAMGVRFASGAGINRCQPIGAPAGTVVAVENLFYNTPARLKFLKNDATEKRHIHWVVARYAMAYPGVAFVLVQDGRERFHSSGSGQLADVVAKAFGLREYNCMVAVEGQERAGNGRVAISISGFTSNLTLSRARRDRIILFVNGRAIQDSSLTHAVIQAYDGLLKERSFPLAVLLITTPPDFVDVNVHPTKAEIRFRDSQQVFLAVQRAVREAIIEQVDGEPVDDLWSASGFTNQYIEYKPLQPPWQPESGTALVDEQGLQYVPELAEPSARPRTLPILRVVGQVGAAYIVAEGPAGLYLVDQNAAHERVIYQQLTEDHAQGRISSQVQAETQTVLLSHEDALLLESVGEQLAALGFEIELFGPSAFACRSLPEAAAGLQLDELMTRMLEQLRGAEPQLENVIKALASAVAVRSGQIMTIDEMRSLIARLERCPNPLSSPSGRRVLIHMSSEQLADQFRIR